MTYLITAFRPGPFADNLAIQPATNMDKLRQRATQFMYVEELREFKNQTKVEQNQGKQNDRDHNPPKTREVPGPSKFMKYTPLNTGRTRIFEETLSAELITAPHKFC